MRPRVIIGIVLVVLILTAGIWLITAGQSPASIPASSKGGLIYLSPSPDATLLPSRPSAPTPAFAANKAGAFEPSTLPPSPVPTQAASGPGTATPVFTTSQTPPSRVIIPYKIKIPSLGIDTFVERVGVASDGSMDVPKNIWNTAWFGNGGYKPGETGNAVIAGHLDAPGTKAVFWDLDKLKPGARLYLSDTGGQELTFEVIELKEYLVAEAPLAQIFGPATEPRLNLITCSGVFNRASQLYNKRLVVFTRLVR